MGASVIEHVLRSERDAALVPVHEFNEAMEALSGTAWSAYRQLMEMPQMLAYLQDSSPLEELSLLNLGSRPARRTQARTLGDLRAIPWVFAWTQNRHLVTGWYGVGSGIKAFLDVRRERGLELLRRMFHEARLFRLILDDVERTLLQVDLKIAREYAALIEDEAVREPIFTRIEEEYRLTCEMILRISGDAAIAERFPQFKRRLARRLKTPMRSAASQVRLLRAHRAESSEELRTALLMSINCAAAGFGATGCESIFRALRGLHMSFTSIEPATPRLHRSELAVPGSNTALFEKAAKSAADVVFLDVEDAVAPDDKEQARKNIIQALNDLDWGAKTMMVRINGLDTHYMYRDVVDIVEACPRLDMMLIPKVGVAADVYAVDMMVTQIEAAKKRSKRIGFEVLIETALGMANVETIATVEQALGGHVLRRRRLCGIDPRAHHGDRRGQPRLRRADRQERRGQARVFLDRSLARGADPHAGRLPGVWPAPHRWPVRRFQRPRRLSSCGEPRRRARLRGQMGDPPSQIALCNEVFTPSAAEVTKAKRIMEAMAQAAREGRGAVSLDGRLIDYASIRMAEALLKKAAAMEAGALRE